MTEFGVILADLPYVVSVQKKFQLFIIGSEVNGIFSYFDTKTVHSLLFTVLQTVM
jgi:hypothetical protein